MTKEKMEEIFERAFGNAKPYTGPKLKTMKKPSLFEIIKTKEQAERFMKQLESLR